MSSHTRILSICTFADEKATTPIKVGEVTWADVLTIHARRQCRPNKSGFMLGGYKILGPRANGNVPFRSLIQLDIDTLGVKDKATGRITHVTRAAPALAQIRPSIAEYEWCAASSHSHDPQRGVIKYRVTILPDRDILPHEWVPVLEAADEVLGGNLDRGAWAWSQAFYLPSSPQERASDAFFEHNQGRALPVDEFVRRGQEILEARGVAPKPRDEPPVSPDATNRRLGDNTTRADLEPPPVEDMQAALEHLMAKDFFEHRSGVQANSDSRIVKVGWRECGMALKAAYGDEGLDLWATTHADEQAHADAPKQWTSFAATAQPGHVSIGTLIKAAKDAGFVFGLASRPPSANPSTGSVGRFAGRGGDVKNGQLFADMFRNRLVHVHETGDWLQFDTQQGWVSAPPGEADRAAKEVLGALRRQAANRYATAPDDPATKRVMAHVQYTSKAVSLRAMIEMAKSEPGMTVRLNEFDSDPMLLGVANGVLDLALGVLLPPTPGRLVSKRCNVAYDPKADCPRFRQFLKEVHADKDVRAFLRRFMGYCLTGSVDEQFFAFLYGLGANGKSVFIELTAWLLGDYARKIATDMLMHHQRNPQGPSPDIVSLKGLRLAFANETEEGRRLAEARVKDMTGGDTLSGRVPYGKADISFRPTHKLIIVGNHKPDITDNSFGMWRRVVLVHFAQTIPEAARDPHLLEVLKSEGAGVLNWMLSGLQAYQKGGLQIPAQITAATAAYREEQDILSDWIGDDCTTGAGCAVKKGVLYADYAEWAKRNGHKPFSQGRLTRRLNERGYKLAADKRTVHGLALLPTTVGGLHP